MQFLAVLPILRLCPLLLLEALHPILPVTHLQAGQPSESLSQYEPALRQLPETPSCRLGTNACKRALPHRHRSLNRMRALRAQACRASPSGACRQSALQQSTVRRACRRMEQRRFRQVAVLPVSSAQHCASRTGR